MKQINKLKSMLFGATPIYLANEGKPIDQLVVRHGDLFFMIDIDVESGDPTGSFGWSRGQAMTHVPIREFYTATRPGVQAHTEADIHGHGNDMWPEGRG